MAINFQSQVRLTHGGMDPLLPNKATKRTMDTSKEDFASRKSLADNEEVHVQFHPLAYPNMQHAAKFGQHVPLIVTKGTRKSAALTVMQLASLFTESYLEMQTAYASLKKKDPTFKFLSCDELFVRDLSPVAMPKDLFAPHRPPKITRAAHFLTKDYNPDLIFTPNHVVKMFSYLGIVQHFDGFNPKGLALVNVRGVSLVQDHWGAGEALQTGSILGFIIKNDDHGRLLVIPWSSKGKAMGPELNELVGRDLANHATVGVFLQVGLFSEINNAGADRSKLIKEANEESLLVTALSANRRDLRIILRPSLR
jgi:hypothetical protein